MARWWVALGFTLCLWAVSPALGDMLSDLRANCAQPDNVDLRMQACTALIEGGSGTDSNRAAAYINRGNAWRQKGNRDAALNDYSAAISLDPAKADAYFNRANTLALLKRYDEALRDYDQVLVIEPTYRNLHGFKGRVHELMENWQEAANSYRALLAVDPSSDEARRLLFEMESKLEGRTTSQQAQSLGEDIAACKDKQDLAACTRLLDNGMVHGPARANVYYLRSLIFSARDDHTSAIADLNESIALDDKQAVTHFLRASAYMFIEEREKAMADFNTAIRINPKLAEAHDRRGLLHHVMGNLPAALADLRKALELNNNLPNAGDIRSEIAEIELALSKAGPVAVPAIVPPETGLSHDPKSAMINTAVTGSELTFLPARTVESCQFHCASEPRCAAWTLDLWNANCTLTEQPLALRVEPSSMGGMARDRPTPPNSVAPLVFHRYPDESFSLANSSPSTLPDADACEATCATSSLCAVYTYVPETSACHVFPYSDVFTRELGAMSGIKRQVQ